jgi:hypothetical protein
MFLCADGWFEILASHNERPLENPNFSNENNKYPEFFALFLEINL